MTLSDRFGTPSYVYDLAAVRAAHADLTAVLPRPSTLYYSLKANPHPLVVRQLARLGCRAEVSSVGELEAASRAGVPPGNILLTGPGKTVSTIDRGLQLGVDRFSVDSPADLDRVGERATAHGVSAECLLRINADERVAGMGLTMTGTASQFGADAGWVEREPRRFRASGGARVRGLHLYMGTNLDSEDALMAQFEVAVSLAARLAPLLGAPAEIDLGGGFGAPYARAGDRPRYPTLAARLAALLDRYLPGWREAHPRVSFESGRYLVADSGSLLCRVLDVKPSKDEVFVVLDTGIHHLGGMAGLRRIPRIVPDLDGAGGAQMHGAVVGPLCTPLDTFSRGVDMARPAIGDVVSIPNVGAYGLTASLLAFLGHPAPAEIVVDGDEVLSASRLELIRAPIGAELRSGR